MAKVTIKDVAREAGVSIATVSNALNDVDVLKPETKQHVLQVAAQLNYIPDVNGRNLKLGRTKVIGLFVPCLDSGFYGNLANAIFWECQKNGYELNVFISHQSAIMMNNILGKRVAGAIILNNRIEQDHVEGLKDAQIPVVFLDREVQSDKMGAVLFDSYQAGAMAARYLLDKGFTKLGYVMGIVKSYDDNLRYQGYKDVICQAGLKLRDEYVLTGGFERKVAYDATKRFLSENIPLPEAIFAANDLSAVGCMEALKEAGFSIPGDVSVVGCDDVELAQWFVPSLTTVHTEWKQQGICAMQMLLKMIKEEEQGEIIRLKGHIVERESVK